MLANMMGSRELSLLTVKCFTKLFPGAVKSTPVCGCWDGILVTMSAGMNLSQRLFSKCQTAVFRELHRKASKEGGSSLRLVWNFLWKLSFSVEIHQVAREPCQPGTGPETHLVAIYLFICYHRESERFQKVNDYIPLHISPGRGLPVWLWSSNHVCRPG